jgi:hypothetical protein
MLIPGRLVPADSCSTGTSPEYRPADACLSLDALGRIEGGDAVVEVYDLTDVRPQASVPRSLDDLTQLGAVGHDNEVDR